ncbi:putative oxygenase MesX, partial [Acetobacter tropicalis]
MIKDFTFSINRVRFDENYHPSDKTRLTTNFANLARGESRQKNLHNVLKMIDNRFNDIAHWDNARGDRYSIELEIVSVEMDIDFSGKSDNFPLIEVLNTTIVDKKDNKRIDGVVGNSFSSYVRDYDFSVLLPNYNKDRSEFSIPHNYGNLHGNLFKSIVK